MKFGLKIAFISLFILGIHLAHAADDNQQQQDQPEKNEADELDKIVLHSFEHFDYLDILYKLKGHNSETWVCLFYLDEDHHKTHRDDIKRLIFKENKDFKYIEADVSKPNYAPIKQVIRFPQNANADDYPMILIMKNQVGQMVYGPGVARKAKDLVDAMKAKEEAEKKKAEEAANKNK